MTDEILLSGKVEDKMRKISNLKAGQEVFEGKTYQIFLEDWFIPDWSSEQKFIGSPIYSSVKAVQFEIDGEKRWFPKTAIRKVKEMVDG